MLIVITSELTVKDEQKIMNDMLCNGLQHLHIRKYAFSDTEMLNYVNNIDLGFRKHLVLHSHYHLADELGIERLHFGEQGRKNESYFQYGNDYSLSTSVHDISDFKSLRKEWKYAFISPVFPSISKKGHGQSSNLLNKFDECINEDVLPVALGGINSDNMSKLLTSGILNVALLGAVWENSKPFDAFVKCQKVYEEFKK